MHLYLYIYDRFENPYMKHGIGTSCVARCCPGFVLVGNDTVTCQYDGKWSQPEYECVGKFHVARYVAASL